jgi:hypothetical protein
MLMSNDPVDIKILRKRLGELENWRAHTQVKVTQLRDRIDTLSARLFDLEKKGRDNDRTRKT